MTTPGGGGDRLEVSVVADATGFARDAQAKIDAATANVRARIRADIDTRRLEAQMQAAAKRASAGAQAKVQLSLDSAHFQASVQAAVEEANARRYAIKVGIEVDRSQLSEATRAAGSAGGTINQRIVTTGGGDQSIRVTADTTEANARIDAMRREQSSRIIDVPVQVDSEGSSGGGGARGGRGIRAITGGMSGLEKFGFYAGLVQTLGSAVDALGSGLISLAGAGSQALGALAALPNLAGAAAQGIGSLVLGFSGVGKAVQLMTRAQTSGARTSQATADAQIRAQEAVANARQNVADVAKAGNDRIAASEHSVAMAQLATKSAQQQLTQARKDAAQALKDYKNQLADASLNEESATLAIQRAREAWNKAMQSPTSTALDRQEADLNLRQAEQNLVDIKASNDQLKQQADAATKAGVDGAANVVNAKQGVADATYSQAQAEKQLADDRNQATKDNLRAQQQLADAIRSLNQVTAQQSATTSQLAAAMANLSPAGREFAKFVKNELMPRFYDLRGAVQEALLPPVQRGVTAAMPLLRTLQGGLVQSGSIMGSFIERLGVMMGSPVFRREVGSIMESNNVALGHFTNAGLSLVNVLVKLAVAAEPLAERFSVWVQKWADYASAAADAGTSSGKLAAFMDRAGDRFAQIGGIIGNLARALFGMGKAGTQAGGDLFDSLDRVTKKWAEFTGSAKGQSEMKDYFDRMEPVVEKLGKTLGDIVQLIVDMGSHKETLNIILGIIDGVAKGLDFIFGIPIVGPFVAGLMGLAGVAALLLTFIKRLTKIKDLFDTIGRARTSVGQAVGRVGDAANRSRASTTADRVSRTTITETRETDEEEPTPAATPRQSARRRLNATRRAALRRRGGSAVDDLDSATDDIISGTDDRLSGRTSRRGGRVRRAASSARSRLSGERGSMSIGGFLPGGGRMATASNGDVVGGLGGEVAGFAASVQKAADTASKYLGGWAGKATKTVAGFAGAASTLVANWADSGVGKAVSTAGGWVQTFAQNSEKSIGDWVSIARGKAGEWAGAIGGKASQAASSVAGFASSAGGTVSRWATAAGTSIAGWASSARTAAGTAMGAIGSAASGAAGKVKDLAKAGGALASAGWSALKDAGKWMWDLSKAALAGALNIGKQVLAWIAQKVAMVASAVAEGVMTAATWLLNIALDANPIGLIILAIGALIAIIVLLVTHWNTVKNAIVDGAKWVGDKLSGIWNWIKDTAIGAWNGLVGGIKSILSGIGGFVRGVFDEIGSIIKGAINLYTSAINHTVIAGVNLVIRGINDVNPFSDIPSIPNIPRLARGALVRKPTLAVVGEDGDELVLPLSAGKSARRDQLLAQAGLGSGSGSLWGGSSTDGSLAQQVAAGTAATDASPRSGIGTYIAEGAVQQTIHNPVPEKPSQTLNAQMRRLAALGLFAGPSAATGVAG